MKICLVNKSFSDKVWDGIFTYTHYLAQGLSKHGHEVHILTKHSNSHRLPKKESDKIFIHQIKLPWLARATYFSKLGEILYGLKVYFKFREIDKKLGIDVVEAPEAGAEGFWLALFCPQKLVTRLHTPMLICFKLNGLKINFGRRVLGLMEKLQIKRSVLLSSPTKSLAQIVSKMWQIEKEKITIIPNPINIQEFKKYFKASQTQEKKYLLYLGRIERLKGVDIFLKSLEIVIEKYPKLSIFFAGGIDQTYNQDNLKKIPQKIKKNLVFLGELSRHQVFAYIQGAQMGILPSLWENLPYTLLESLASGKVIIASDCGGFKEIIKDNQNGLLVQPGSSQHLAQKIIEGLKLEKNKIKQIENDAKDTALGYDLKEIIPRIIMFYSKAKILGGTDKKGLNWSKISSKRLQTLLRPKGLWGEEQGIENKGRQKLEK